MVRRIVLAATILTTLTRLGSRRRFRRVREPFVPWGNPVSRHPFRIRVMSLNIAHGRATAFHQALVRNGSIRRNLDAIADFLREEGPDVVGLQEVDIDARWTGGIDQAAYLAERAGYPYVRVGVNNRTDEFGGLHYGNAILSRRPIVEVRNYPFGTAPLGEKGCLVARIRVEGTDLAVAVTHLDFKAPRSRRRQADTMAEILRNLDGPLVVMGDFNCGFGGTERTLHDLRDALGLACGDFGDADGLTFPARRPSRRIDHILAGHGLAIRSCDALPVVLSDHRPIVAEVFYAGGGRLPPLDPPGGAL